MDSLASGSTSSEFVSSPTPKELAQRALSANKILQQTLTKRAEQLEAEIKEVDRLLDAASTDEALDDDAENGIEIPGAKKPAGWFPVAECLSPDSPFYRGSMLRNQYASRINTHFMKGKELVALGDAVKRENQRLEAYRLQEKSSLAEAIDLVNNVEGVDWCIVAEKVSDVAKVKYTPEQCRIKWIGDQHPRINHSDWQPAELQQLAVLVEEAKNTTSGTINWVDVVKKLGTNRTPVECMIRGISQPRHEWNPESDKRLIDAVDIYGLDNWMLVARYVSECATPGQCQGRYTKSLDPTIKRGTWTAEEDERLKKAVAVFGSSWIRVAEFISGRTNDQCHERWTEQMNTSSSKNVWSGSEDKILLDAVNTMGNKWKVISEMIGNAKTGTSCRLRYNNLMKAASKSTPAASSARSTPIQPNAQEGNKRTLTPFAVQDFAESSSEKGKEKAQDAGYASTAANSHPIVASSAVATTGATNKGRKRTALTLSADPPAAKKRRKKTISADDVDKLGDETISQNQSGPSEMAATNFKSGQQTRPKPRPVRKRKTTELGNDLKASSTADGTISIVLPGNETVHDQSFPLCHLTADCNEIGCESLPMQQTAGLKSPEVSTQVVDAISTFSKPRRRGRPKKSAAFVIEDEDPMEMSFQIEGVSPASTKAKQGNNKSPITAGKRRSARFAPVSETLNQDHSDSTVVNNSLPADERMDTQEDDAGSKATTTTNTSHFIG